jgi:hypothetical protein
MAESFARKRSKVLHGLGFACARRIKQGVKSTETDPPDTGNPLASTGIEGNALDAACVVRPYLAVAKVIAMPSKAQVGCLVIGSIAVDVVNKEPIGYCAVHVDPCSPVSVLGGSASMEGDIPIRCIHRAARLAYTALLPWTSCLDSCEQTSGGVKGAKLLQSFLRCIHGFIHTISTDKECYV